MKTIDFSCKHHILLESEDGSLQPMDEPYFQATKIAPGTWQVLSDGDYSYLVEGEDEALVIDSGYGAGNIREFCQTLTEKPVRRIANTHHHFDHTANNGYFELAYMAPESVPLATIPFPSFDGIAFPRDYPIQTVDDGDRIPLKGRDLVVIKIPDHTEGGIAFLDKKEGILFSGDEFMIHRGKDLNGSVERWKNSLERLMTYRPFFHTLWGGGGMLEADMVEANLENARYILSGHEGVHQEPMPFPDFTAFSADGRPIWKRRIPHPGDGPKEWGKDQEYKLTMDYAGCRITYDIRRIREG